MWDFKVLGVDLYHILFWLILYSFLGWVWESSYVSIKEKRLVNRGFVTGPVCTIYGVGAMSVYVLLRPLANHGLWLFLGGIILATVLEYVTAWVMETLFHTSWWDYSDKPFNIQGRICLGSSIAWGFFTLLMFDVLQPFAEWVIGLFAVATGHAFVILCGILYAVDFTVSSLAAFKLGKKLARLQTVMEDFSEYLQSTRLYESAEDVRELLGTYKKQFPSLKEIQDRVGDYQNGFQKRIEEKGLTEYLESFREHTRNFREQYQEGISKITGVNRRFMRAYPNIHKAYRRRKDKKSNNKNK